MGNRCMVTGALVTADALCLLVNDGLPCSPPTQLHTRIIEGRTGARRFSARALTAMHDPRDLVILSDDEREWYTLDWIEAELHKHFPRQYVDVILLVRRDHVHWDIALAGTGLDYDECKTWMRAMQKHARKLIKAKAA